MLLLGSAILLGIIAVANYRCARSCLYPAFVYTVIWSLALALLYTTSAWFYPVSWASVRIHLLGAIAFSVGGAAVLLLPMTPFKPKERLISGRRRVIVHKAFDCLLPGAIALLPLYLLFLKQRADMWGGHGAFLVRMRRGTMVALDAPGSHPPFSIAAALVPFVVIVALYALNEYDGSVTRRWRTYAFVSLAVLYEVLGATRSDMMLVIVAVIVIAALHRGKIPVTAVVLIGVGVVAVFSANQILLEKDGTKADAPLSYNVPYLIEGFTNYAIGGMVAFDYSVEHPGAIRNQWTLNKFFVRTANKFGAEMEDYSRHLEFVRVNPHQEANVYTIYFAYMDYGGAGLAGILALLGAGTALLYRRALRGNPIATVLFATSTFAVVMSIFGEEFFSQMGFWLKVVVVGYLLYFSPQVLPRFIMQRHTARSRYNATTLP